MRRWLPVLVPALVVLALGAAPARAQYFGKNKVQYESLRWAVLETPHVRLHFYAEEESLARRMAALAESVCVAYDARFRVTPAGRCRCCSTRRTTCSSRPTPPPSCSPRPPAA
jgi:hypothetical protein